MIQVRRWIPMHADLARSMFLRFPVQSCSMCGFRLFMQSRRSRVSGLSCKAAGRVLPGFCFPCECGFRQVRLPVERGFPSSPASRANVASGRARLCRNLTDTSFLSVPLRAHLSGDRSITINPLSAVHFWYFSSISGRNREAFYQKYFYGISVLADILGIKPYFHKKNTRNRYQINSSW